ARLQVRLLSSVAPLALMATLLGEGGVEQYHFAADELRRAVTKSSALDGVTFPTSLLVAGDVLSACTKDREGLLTSILASSSCLVRSDTTIANPFPNTPHQPRLITALCEHVSVLQPLVARDLFNQKVVVENNTVEIPILGNRIFGAPVSFCSGLAEQKTKAT